MKYYIKKLMQRLNFEPQLLLNIITICVIILFLFSCKKSSTTFAPEKISLIQRIQTKLDSSQSYYVYLPSNYDTTKEYPVIFAFDPHAKGDIPVKRMMQSAEQLGYIIAGSNNSYNQAQNLEYIINSFFYDVTSRFKINSDRVYVAGFSGGARIASTMAFMSKHIAGVISCGAGIYFPAERLKGSSVKFFGACGNQDFNLSEMKSTQKLLEETNVPHYIYYFNGPHDWPSDTVLHSALYWFELQAMRDNIIPMNEKLINDFYEFTLQELKTSKRNNNILLSFQIAERGLIFCQGLRNIKKIRQEYYNIKNSDDFITALQEENKYEMDENTKRLNYQQALIEKSPDWWTTEINKIQKTIENSTNTSEKALYIRMKNFLGIMAYSLTSEAIKNGTLQEQKRLLKIYELLEQNNPDVFYFKTKFYLKNNQKDSAISQFLHALELGFSRLEEIKQDPMMNNLLNSAEIKTALAKKP